MKALIYSRTSQEDKKEDKTSIADQLAECRKLAKESGYEIIGEFHDKDRSGRTYPTGVADAVAEQDTIVAAYCKEKIHRPNHFTRDGLAQVIQRLPQADVLLCRDSFRLMRPLLNSFLESYIWQALARNGVILHTRAEGIIKPQDHNARMVSGLRSTSEDKSVQDKVAHSKTALDTKRDDGKLYRCPTMIGFRSGGLQQVLATPDIPIVRRIADEFLKGTSLTEIARTLSVEKIKRLGECHIWTTQLVRRILLRPEYSGQQRNSKGDLVPCKPLQGIAPLTPEEFDLIQSRFTRKQPLMTKERHPFTGIIYCGYCGDKLYVRRTNHIDDNSLPPTWYYACIKKTLYTRRTPESLGCRKVLIRERKPDDPRLGTGLYESLMPLTIFGHIDQMKMQHGAADLKRQQIEIENQDYNLEQRSGELEKMVTAADLDMDDFRRLSQSLKVQRDALRRRKAEVNGKLEMISVGFKDTDVFLRFLKSHTSAPARELIHKVIRRIDVYAYHFRVTLANGATFMLERVPARASRLAPHPYCKFPKRFTETTHLTIRYIYKTARTKRDQTERTIYKDANLTIVTIGSNPKPYEYANRRHKKHAKCLPEYVYYAPSQKPA